MIEKIIKTLKINHYIKNLVVFAPLLFSAKLVTTELFIKTFFVFWAFCFISSAVYIMNDFIDIEKDKKHPIKANRPIASGVLTFKEGIVLFVILILSSCFLGYKINPVSLYFILGYLLINIFYSLKLQNIILVDAMSIAVGFLFRLIAGYNILNINPSSTLILLTIFISMFFTFTKRKLELKFIRENQVIRKSLENTDETAINIIISTVAIISIALYIILTLDKTISENTGTENLYLTSIPFAMIFLRLFLLPETNNSFDDPVIFFKDNILKLFLIIYIIVFLVVCTV